MEDDLVLFHRAVYDMANAISQRQGIRIEAVDIEWQMRPIAMKLGDSTFVPHVINVSVKSSR